MAALHDGLDVARDTVTRHAAADEQAVGQEVSSVAQEFHRLYSYSRLATGCRTSAGRITPERACSASRRHREGDFERLLTDLCRLAEPKSIETGFLRAAMLGIEILGYAVVAVP